MHAHQIKKVVRMFLINTQKINKYGLITTRLLAMMYIKIYMVQQVSATQRVPRETIACFHLFYEVDNLFIYSGNRIRSTPRDRENVLTLSEVDLIRIQRNIVKYSQVSNSVIWRHVIVSLSVAVCLSEPVSTVLLTCS